MTAHPKTALELLAHQAPYDEARAALQRERRRWLITGGAGFIGSHLAETLLDLDQEVVVLDDLSTGSRANLTHVRNATRDGARHLAFVHGDVRDESLVHALVRRVDVVLHQAAQVSVPASIETPTLSHDVNVTGFLNILEAARRNGTRIIYAASSASYGDDPAERKRENHTGRPLSMYAASKTASEAYAAAYHAAYDLPTIGLRYFNVYGARQDPSGPYAAVIPAWIDATRRGEACTIHGDGHTTRDFCHVANVVGATLLAALTYHEDALGHVLNVGTGHATSLLELHDAIHQAIQTLQPQVTKREPSFAPFRPGDVRHSCADVRRARDVLGYEPVVDLATGIDATVASALDAPPHPLNTQTLHARSLPLALQQERSSP